jgi:hypothetical protein
MGSHQDGAGKALLLYSAALYSAEEFRSQLCRMGVEDPGTEDAELLRREILDEVERRRRTEDT